MGFATVSGGGLRDIRKPGGGLIAHCARSSCGQTPRQSERAVRTGVPLARSRGIGSGLDAATVVGRGLLQQGFRWQRATHCGGSSGGLTPLGANRQWRWQSRGSAVAPGSGADWMPLRSSAGGCGNRESDGGEPRTVAVAQVV